MCLRSYRQSVSQVSSSQSANRKTIKFAAALLAFLFATLNGFTQDQPLPGNPPGGPQTPSQAIAPSTVTLPAGTSIPLVLTHSIQSRYVRRGDDVYAQVTSPVNSGNEVVIPPGAFVQGVVDRLDRKGRRGELHLESMSITFPDGYVAPISGPMTLETDDGYAIKDPGQGRFIGAFALPAAGAGLGALIGHSVGGSPSTITSTLPPGCTGPPPGCLTSSVTGSSNVGRNTVIGAGIGGIIGAIASMTVLFSSRHFFLDVGSPVEMTLQKPVTLQENEVANAEWQAEQHPQPQQPIVQRPMPPPPEIPGQEGNR